MRNEQYPFIHETTFITTTIDPVDNQCFRGIFDVLKGTAFLECFFVDKLGPFFVIKDGQL